MITHEEAREIVDRIYVHTDWETKDKLLAYITQQEKVTELLGLYKKQNENITSFDYWKVSPIDVIQAKRWIDEIDKTEQKIKQLEKELGEMK